MTKHKMRIAFLIFFMVVSSTFSSFGQEVDIVNENSATINAFAIRIRNIKHFLDANNCCFGIRLIESGSLIGSFPGEDGKDIVLFDLYFYIKQFDEKSEKTSTGNFWVKGNYHNPRDYNFLASDRRLTFIHGTEKNPIKVSLLLSSSKIIIE